MYHLLCGVLLSGSGPAWYRLLLYIWHPPCPISSRPPLTTRRNRRNMSPEYSRLSIRFRRAPNVRTLHYNFVSPPFPIFILSRIYYNRCIHIYVLNICPYIKLYELFLIDILLHKPQSSQRFVILRGKLYINIDIPTNPSPKQTLIEFHQCFSYENLYRHYGWDFFVKSLAIRYFYTDKHWRSHFIDIPQ